MTFPGINHFILPTHINIVASDYFQMIAFDKVHPPWITESPFTETYTEEQLISFVNMGRLMLLDIPCHSKADMTLKVAVCLLIEEAEEASHDPHKSKCLVWPESHTFFKYANQNKCSFGCPKNRRVSKRLFQGTFHNKVRSLPDKSKILCSAKTFGTHSFSNKNSNKLLRAQLAEIVPPCNTVILQHL